MNELHEYLVLETASIDEAMAQIDSTGSGFCFVVADGKKIVGTLTDGDIRRALLKSGKVNVSVLECCNTEFQYGLISDSYEVLIQRLNKKIQFLPILDNERKLVNFITHENKAFIPILEPELGAEELENVTDCMNSGWISSNGKYVTTFETEFSKLHDERSAVAVSNGTVALHLALVTLGIGPGDEVIVPSLTFAASAATIIHSGAIPVFCECDANLCIDPQEIQALITKKTKAILVVHLYGRIAEMQQIRDIASTYNLLLIEDAAEALGSVLNDRLAGTFSDAATFSFFGNKTITTGEGGMVLFKQPHFAKKAKILRDHGMSKTKRYWHDFVGFNYRMTNLQAAIGVAQLSKLSKIIHAKRNVLKLYRNYFNRHNIYKYYSSERSGEKNSNWLYAVVFDRDVNISIIMDNLNKKQIDTRPVFYPLHLMPPYSKFTTSKNMENTLNSSSRGICLPSSSTLTTDDVTRIINAFDAEVKRQFDV